MPIKQAQYMHGAENRLTVISIMLEETTESGKIESFFARIMDSKCMR